MHRLIPVLILIASAANADDTVSPDAIAETARVWEPAKVLTRKAPKYPQLELRRDREAWVEVEYCIDESGKPQNIVARQSTGSRWFDEAAVEAVEQFEFQPARADGEPIWQSRNRVLITFAIEKPRSARPSFVRKLRKANRLIQEGELDEAKTALEKLREMSALSLYEISILWSQIAYYEEQTGDFKSQRAALQRAIASDGQWISKQNYSELLGKLIVTELQLGHYYAAREHYDTMREKFGDSDKLVSSLAPAMQRLDELVASDNALRVPATLSDRCEDCSVSWAFTPVRSTIGIANVSGELDSIEMRCDRKRFTSEVSDSVQWKIPETWGKCSVRFHGNPGTSFDVLMLPDAA